MPAEPKGEGTVFPLRNGKYKAEIITGYKPDGSKRTRSKTCATWDEARAALRLLVNEREALGPRTHQKAPHELTFADWLAEWLPRHAAEKDIGDATREGYETVIKTWIVPGIGSHRLDKVTARQVRGVLDKMAHLKSSPRQAYIVMKAALDMAQRDRLIIRNPAADVTPPKQKRARIEPPDRDAVDAIFASIVGKPDEARWLIALVLGLRQGEALGLEWRSVDLEAGVLTVEQQLRRKRGRHGCGEGVSRGRTENGGNRGTWWPCGHSHARKCPQGVAGGLILKSTKTEQGDRAVPFPAWVGDLFRELAARQRKERAARRYKPAVLPVDGRERATDLVFRSPGGRPTDPRADYENWQHMLSEAGLGKTRLHNARHAAVVGMINSGMPVERVSTLVGHSSFSFTKRTYGHWTREAADETREALDAYYAPRRKPARDDDAADAAGLNVVQLRPRARQASSGKQ